MITWFLVVIVIGIVIAFWSYVHWILSFKKAVIRKEEERHAAQSNLAMALGQANWVDQEGDKQLKEVQSREDAMIDKTHHAIEMCSENSKNVFIQSFPHQQSIDFLNTLWLTRYKAIDNVRFAAEKLNISETELRILLRTPLRPTIAHESPGDMFPVASIKQLEEFKNKITGTINQNNQEKSGESYSNKTNDDNQFEE